MLIFGTRGYLQVLAMVNFVCNNCHNPAAQRVVQRVTRFTLFFIPLVPISKSYTTTCTFCGFSQKITQQLADQYAGHAGQQAQGDAVGPAREQIAAGAPAGQLGAQQYGSPARITQRDQTPEPLRPPQQSSPQFGPQQPGSATPAAQPYSDPSAP